MNIRYPIYEGVYRILTVKQSFPISRAGMRTASTGKVFGGKYRSGARMIFPETRRA